MAWRIDNSAVALGMFFPLVIVVIIATYIVMEYGSIAFLRAVKANKRIYYRPSSFIAIFGHDTAHAPERPLPRHDMHTFNNACCNRIGHAVPLRRARGDAA